MQSVSDHYVFQLISWVALPTVMFGGYSLLRLLNRAEVQRDPPWLRQRANRW